MCSVEAVDTSECSHRQSVSISVSSEPEKYKLYVATQLTQRHLYTYMYMQVDLIFQIYMKSPMQGYVEYMYCIVIHVSISTFMRSTYHYSQLNSFCISTKL